MPPKERRSPREAGFRNKHRLGGRIDYSQLAGKALPRDWRDRLPDPAKYYADNIAKLTPPNALGWAQGRCPFHEDNNASLSVQVVGTRGSWRCFASCGGGDLLGFHMRKTGLDFKGAVFALIGERR